MSVNPLDLLILLAGINLFALVTMILVSRLLGRRASKAERPSETAAPDGDAFARLLQEADAGEADAGLRGENLLARDMARYLERNGRRPASAATAAPEQASRDSGNGDDQIFNQFRNFLAERSSRRGDRAEGENRETDPIPLPGDALRDPEKGKAALASLLQEFVDRAGLEPTGGPLGRPGEAQT